MKKILYHGILILERGIRINFEMDFEHIDDAPKWVNRVLYGDLPTQEFLWIVEEGTNKIFYIPKNKILAYSVEETNL